MLQRAHNSQTLKLARVRGAAGGGDSEAREPIGARNQGALRWDDDPWQEGLREELT